MRPSPRITLAVFRLLAGAALVACAWTAAGASTARSASRGSPTPAGGASRAEVAAPPGSPAGAAPPDTSASATAPETPAPEGEILGPSAPRRSTLLPSATVRDVESVDQLFERGIPVMSESFSPDGFHFAFLHHVPSGIFRRKPERCAFLLDLGSGETRPIKTPKGRAARLGGWDPTGRYLLIESVEPSFLSTLTGSWTTYHWVFDAVTGRYVRRQPFTGRRDDRAFLWRHPKSYHGAWNAEADAKVWPLDEGELAQIYRKRESMLVHEDNRRLEMAERLVVESRGGQRRELAEVLSRLDAHWTRQGQRDPVISELFGDRPALFFGTEGDWIEIFSETEYVAVLDRGFALITGPGAEQWILNGERLELLPLPPPPEGFSELLDSRWDRAGEYYHQFDPLPRDLQYRRSFDTTTGVGYYFNYVTPDCSHALLMYSFSPEKRVLRIVDLPPGWRSSEEPAASS